MASYTLSLMNYYSSIVRTFLNGRVGFSRGKGGVWVKHYSPMSWTTSVLSRDRTSSSMKTICCQVPSTRLFSLIGTNRSGPRSAKSLVLGTWQQIVFIELDVR